MGAPVIGSPLLRTMIRYIYDVKLTRRIQVSLPHKPTIEEMRTLEATYAPFGFEEFQYAGPVDINDELSDSGNGSSGICDAVDDTGQRDSGGILQGASTGSDVLHSNGK